MAAAPVLPAYDVSVVDSPVTLQDVARRIAELEGTVAELETTLQTQRRIGAAVGVVAARYRCTTDQAWDLVAEVSRESRVGIQDLARILLDAVDAGATSGDADLLAVLAGQLSDQLTDTLPDGR